MSITGIIFISLFFATGLFRMLYENIPQMQSQYFKEKKLLEDDDDDEDFFTL